MNFAKWFSVQPALLMEGALGERLKREFGLHIDGSVGMADLVRNCAGRDALMMLWQNYRAIAREYALPFLATTPTRRANVERMTDAGYDQTLLMENVAFLRAVQGKEQGEMAIGGLMGCKGDAYTGEGALAREEARAFHHWQAEGFAKAGVDFVMAGILPTLPEAMGMAQAWQDTKLHGVLSFTIRADGRLIDGTFINDAIAEIDDALEDPPVCYMANCVHPDIVRKALMQTENRTERVRRRFLGLQANTSPLPYDALDGAANLYTAEPDTLAQSVRNLRTEYGLKLFGGCCGTDESHLRAIAAVIRS